MNMPATVLLLIFIGAFFALDHYVFMWDADIILARKFMDLLTLIAFWR